MQRPLFHLMPQEMVWAEKRRAGLSASQKKELWERWQVRRLPAELRKTLTWDRGLEIAAHKEFSIATECEVQLAAGRWLAGGLGRQRAGWRCAADAGADVLVEESIAQCIGDRRVAEAPGRDIARPRPSNQG